MMTVYRIGAALGLVAGVAVAQNPPATGGAQPRTTQRVAPAAAAQAQRQQAAQQRRQPDRAQLEQQIRDRIGTALKKNLNLTDDQFAKLQATNKRFEERRRLLVEQERDARMCMRDIMITGDTTNQARVSQALDRMLQVQRQRFELVEAEQKEVAGYLTPLQRARYLGMQEQMFRRVEALRQQGMNRGRAGGPPMGAGMSAGMGQGPGMGQGMGPGMGPGMGQEMGPGMQPGMGQAAPMAGRLRNPQRPLGGQVRPPNAPPAGTVPPDGEIIS